MAKPRFLSLDGVRILVSYFKDQLSGKVDKVDGKSLSDNNFSDEEKAKLAGIEADSQVNIIESISVNGTDQTITNKNVNIDVPLVDDTLQNEGQAADAKATGDAIDELSQSISSTATEIRGEIVDEVADIEQSISAVQESIPTNVSQLNNDAEYTDKDYVDGQIDSIQSSIPTNVSDLTNDSNFTTQTYVDTELAKKVDDVQINGTSIVEDKVANIPLATSETPGTVIIDSDRGLAMSSLGKLQVVPAPSVHIKAGEHRYNSITPKRQHESVFYGLTKAAGVDMASSSNAVGTYTDEAKSAIQTMLGIDTAIADAVSNITSFEFSVVQELPATGEKGIIYLVAHSHDTDDGHDEYIWVNNAFEKLGHADIDLSNYVTFDDYASTSKAGLLKVGGAASGLSLDSEKYLKIARATDNNIKEGADFYRPIVASNQHQSVFYGLAKASGDTTQSASSNEVGVYTDEAKTAIKNMLGVEDPIVDDVQINEVSIVSNGIANIPKGKNGTLGVVKPNGMGVEINNNGELYISSPSLGLIKAGTNQYKPITPTNIHTATFYGLAKAAGDTTQAESSNEVGIYTDEAKAAIQTMLGVDTAISDAISNFVANRYYVCENGEYDSETYVPTLEGELGIIYLVPKPVGNYAIGSAQIGTATIAPTTNIFYEFIYTGEEFEQIGDTKVDLTGYLTDGDIAVNSSITTMLNEVFP